MTNYRNDPQAGLEAALEREEKLREALRAIDRPRKRGVFFTSQQFQDKAHLEQMQEWIDKHCNTENMKHYILNISGGAMMIAEQALKEK